MACPARNRDLVLWTHFWNDSGFFNGFQPQASSALLLFVGCRRRSWCPQAGMCVLAIFWQVMFVLQTYFWHESYVMCKDGHLARRFNWTTLFHLPDKVRFWTTLCWFFRTFSGRMKALACALDPHLWVYWSILVAQHSSVGWTINYWQWFSPGSNFF